MNRKKAILIGLAGIVLAIVGIFAFIINANEYYLELNVPQEPITIEYGADALPEITGVLKGTLLKKKGTPIEITAKNPADTTQLGTTIVTYEAIYKNQSYTIDQEFLVQDTTAPVIELVSDFHKGISERKLVVHVFYHS